MKKRSLTISLVVMWVALFLVSGAVAPGAGQAQQAITSDTFAELAQKTGGAVVNISTEKVVKNKGKEFFSQMPHGPGGPGGPGRTGRAVPLRAGRPLPGIF